MTKYPNRTALFEACNIYRDAMRLFIISRLRQMRGKQVEDIVIDSLESANQFERANEIDRILHQSNRSIESAIDINDFPHLVQVNWGTALKTPLNDDKDFRNQLWLIKTCRDQNWAHPPEGDAESEGTRAYLFFIADVLGKINKQDAKREVENIRNRLLSDEDEEHIVDVSDQLETARAENTKLEKRLSEKEDRLKTIESESAECIKNLREQLIDHVSKLEAKEDTLSKLSDQLRTVAAEKAELEERLETTSTQLEDVEAELTARKEHVARPLRQLKGVKDEPLVEPMRLAEVDAEIALEEDKTNSSKTSPIGPKTNNPNDMDDNQSVTKQPVAPSKFSAEEKKPSISERYVADPTETDRNDVAVKVVERRINASGSKRLSWRRIREKLGLRNDEFHRVIRRSEGYRVAVINRIKSLRAQEGGWDYSGKLDVLTGIDVTEEELS